ncbi:MAG: NADH-quinone oxidoreductase subunit C, partial [Dehalococcoidia bacterium]|nr:NADH-quinone oxidoreductase subunit C [Dehalococcoidia bacterium]
MVTPEGVQDELAVQLCRQLDADSVVERQANGDIRISTPVGRLVDTCVVVNSRFSAPLATMVGLDDRIAAGVFRLVYVFSVGNKWVSVETEIDPKHPIFPSVTPGVPAAHWYEREVQDLLGLVPAGHPDPRRLVLHDDWPPGVHPLRKDFDPAIPVPRVEGARHRFHNLHGEGIVQIPVGPIHAGVIEPGHFRFAAVGEVVLHLETQLFYSHRGLEKLAEGKSIDHVLQIAERVCGACAFSNAVSYSQAIESLADVALPPRAASLRTLFLELERLYNHIGDLGNICAGVGFAVGTSQGGRLKEDLQRLNERLAGHRFLRGICRIGGVRRDIGEAGIRDAAQTLRRVESEFRDFINLIMGKDSFLERLEGTGILPMQAARDLGAVGVAARASGVDRDARRDHPHAAYAPLGLEVPVQSSGDVRARAQVRIEETYVSFRLAGQIISGLPDGPLFTPVHDVPSYAVGIGVTESPRGENVHWVRTGSDNTIDRWRIRSASYCNWPV